MDGSYETVLKRWPIILTGVIDHLHKLNHDLLIEARSGPSGASNLEEAEARITEGTAIVSQISKLKYEMARDRPIEYVFHLYIL
jgi:hypothetical protein